MYKEMQYTKREVVTDLKVALAYILKSWMRSGIEEVKIYMLYVF